MSINIRKIVWVLEWLFVFKLLFPSWPLCVAAFYFKMVWTLCISGRAGQMLPKQHSDLVDHTTFGPWSSLTARLRCPEVTCVAMLVNLLLDPFPLHWHLRITSLVYQKRKVQVSMLGEKNNKIPSELIGLGQKTRLHSPKAHSIFCVKVSIWVFQLCMIVF